MSRHENESNKDRVSHSLALVHTSKLAQSESCTHITQESLWHKRSFEQSASTLHSTEAVFSGAVVVEFVRFWLEANKGNDVQSCAIIMMANIVILKRLGRRYVESKGEEHSDQNLNGPGTLGSIFINDIDDVMMMGH